MMEKIVLLKVSQFEKELKEIKELVKGNKELLNSIYGKIGEK